MYMQVIRDQEKAIVWTSNPAVQRLVFEVCKFLHMKPVLLAAALTTEERRTSLRLFNESNNEGMVLIANYNCGSAGLNLQHKCFRVHVFEQPPNEGILTQALGRSRRFGCPSPTVYVYEYSVRELMNVAAPRAYGTANPTILPTNGAANHIVGQHQDSSHPDFKSPTAVAVDDVNAETTPESLRLAFFKDLTPGFAFKGSIARLTALLQGPPVGIDSDPHHCSHLCHNNPQRCFDPYYTCCEGDSKNISRNGCFNGHAIYSFTTPTSVTPNLQFHQSSVVPSFVLAVLVS